MQILDLYNIFKAKENLSAVASVEEIGNNQYSLAIPLYVERRSAQSEEKIKSPEDFISAWQVKSDISSSAMESFLKTYSKGFTK